MKDFEKVALGLMLDTFIKWSNIVAKNDDDAEFRHLVLQYVANKIYKYAMENKISTNDVLSEYTAKALKIPGYTMSQILTDSFKLGRTYKSEKLRMVTELSELDMAAGLRESWNEAVENLSGDNAVEYALTIKGLTYRDVFLDAASDAMNNVHIFGADQQQVYLANKFDELQNMSEDQIKEFLENTTVLKFLKYNTQYKLDSNTQNLLGNYTDLLQESNREYNASMRRIKRLARKKHNRDDFNRLVTRFPDVADDVTLNVNKKSVLQKLIQREK